MRDANKTIRTKTVQRLVDQINDALYAETNDLSLYVELEPLERQFTDLPEDYLAIYCIKGHLVISEAVCRTSSDLQRTLFYMLSQARFPSQSVTHFWTDEGYIYAEH